MLLPPLCPSPLEIIHPALLLAHPATASCSAGTDTSPLIELQGKGASRADLSNTSPSTVWLGCPGAGVQLSASGQPCTLQSSPKQAVCTGFQVGETKPGLQSACSAAAQPAAATLAQNTLRCRVAVQRPGAAAVAQPGCSRSRPPNIIIASLPPAPLQVDHIWQPYYPESATVAATYTSLPCTYLEADGTSWPGTFSLALPGFLWSPALEQWYPANGMPGSTLSVTCVALLLPPSPPKPPRCGAAAAADAGVGWFLTGCGDLAAAFWSSHGCDRCQ